VKQFAPTVNDICISNEGDARDLVYMGASFKRSSETWRPCHQGEKELPLNRYNGINSRALTEILIL
jgi:hypothetical protein